MATKLRTGGIVILLSVLAFVGWHIARPDAADPATEDAIPVTVAHRVPATTGTGPTPIGANPPASPAPPPTPGATASSDLGDEIAAATRMPPESDPEALHDRVRQERRDPIWAARAEATIRQSLADIPYIGGSNPLGVRCAATLCEVSGLFAPNLSTDNSNVAMQGLQDQKLEDATGLERRAGSFSSAKGRASFLLYFHKR